MSKDYKHVPKQENNPKKWGWGNLMIFFAGLLVGSLITFFIHLKEIDNSLTFIDFNFKKNNLKPENQQIVAEKPIPTSEIDELPAPQFDFYNILPKKEINISEWVAEDQSLSKVEDENQNSVYILQVGSFKQLEAAHQIKLQLSLLGIDAGIQRVVINGQDTRYRVRVGPYVEQSKLNEGRQRLRENNLEFMLLKLEADDPLVTNE